MNQCNRPNPQNCISKMPRGSEYRKNKQSLDPKKAIYLRGIQTKIDHDVREQGSKRWSGQAKDQSTWA